MAPRDKPFAHKFHERLVEDICSRAGRYRHRSRQLHSSGTGKGAEIRARIAANARNRFEIGERMKREAGVVGHVLTGERDGGLAWTDRASILAPAGENMVELATLAHECGHVFLHGAHPGNRLPGHVKEMEAESYAHQAFRAHGMRMPKRITDWGRRYVGQWIEADRAAGIPIDPDAQAYASGLRSPYDRLRTSPWQWSVPQHQHAAFEAESARLASQRLREVVESYRRQTEEKNAILLQELDQQRLHRHHLLGSVGLTPRVIATDDWRWHVRELKREAGTLVRALLFHLFHAFALAWCMIYGLQLWPAAGGLLAQIALTCTAALLWTALVLLWRTATRSHYAGDTRYGRGVIGHLLFKLKSS